MHNTKDLTRNNQINYNKNKHHELPSRMPLTSKLKIFTSLHKSVTNKTQLDKLTASYDNLLALNDDLILLILENNVLNGLIHKQKIVLEDISEQFNREERIAPHAGRFEKDMRTVTIINK